MCQEVREWEPRTGEQGSLGRELGEVGWGGGASPLMENSEVVTQEAATDLQPSLAGRAQGAGGKHPQSQFANGSRRSLVLVRPYCTPGSLLG